MEPYEPYEFALATRGLGSPLHSPAAAGGQINAADLTTNPRIELACLGPQKKKKKTTTTTTHIKENKRKKR